MSWRRRTTRTECVPSQGSLREARGYPLAMPCIRSTSLITSAHPSFESRYSLGLPQRAIDASADSAKARRRRLLDRCCLIVERGELNRRHCWLLTGASSSSVA